MTFAKRMAWIKTLNREELELKYEMCLDHIELLDEEAKTDNAELARLRGAMSLIADGLGVLDNMATVARPNEYESLFQDYAPFSNIWASHYPELKKERKSK